jgi:lipoprotein-anchoring transpeptidase ErfK/SrfK
MTRILMVALTAAAFALPLSLPAYSAPTTDATTQVQQTKKKKVKTARDNAKPKIVASQRAGTKKKCDSFLNCLFGQRKARVTTTSRSTVFSSFSGGSSNKRTRRTVDWDEARYPVGSIVVRTPERALYYISSEGEAIRYSVGVGREGFQWSGNARISGKKEWPSWTPPKVMIEREAEKGIIIPEFMEGGPGNPLGARALYIGGTMFRVHGTNNEASIGRAMSSGCIRMMNADVVDLYNRVDVGARIYVYQ